MKSALFYRDSLLYNWIRSILFNSALAVLTIFFALSCWITLLFPYPMRYWYITRWSFSIVFLARWICGIDYRVHGREHIPTQPCVVVANHQSAWETLFLQLLLPPQTWALKRELFWIPFFGWGLAILRPIALHRGSQHALKDLLEQGLERLSEGLFIIIFPEGTRKPVGQIGPFKKGAARLAAHAGVPILPIWHNAGHCWPRNSFLKKPGTVDVFIGPLLQDSSAQALQAAYEQWFKSIE